MQGSGVLQQVPMPLYMCHCYKCPHTTMYVSSCCDVRVLMLLYVSSYGVLLPLLVAPRKA